MNIITVILLIFNAATLLSGGIHVNLLQNFTGSFGISGRGSVTGSSSHIWIIAGVNIDSVSQEDIFAINNNTVYEVTVNVSSEKALPCGQQYVYLYRQSTSSINTSTLLTATYTGNDILSGSIVIISSVVTVVYEYSGQRSDIGFNATYSIVPSLSTTVNNSLERNCLGYYHHVAVYDENIEKVFLHGGIDHQGVLCDGIEEIQPNSMSTDVIYWLEGPNGRYFHSGIFYTNSLIIYGGRNSTNVFGDMWQFEVINRRWLEYNGNVAVYGHSATLVEDYIIIIGGINLTAVNSAVLQYCIINNTWAVLETYGGTKPTSIFGHTAVYDIVTNKLLVYGGMLLVDLEFDQSNSLYSLDMQSFQWSLLHLTSSNDINLARIFSTSVLFERSIYVFGGLSMNTNDCYSSNMLTFVINSTCGHIPVLRTKEVYPRFGARAINLKNGTVLLSGGYHLWAHNSVVGIVPPQDICTVLQAQNDCVALQWCQFCNFSTPRDSFCVSSLRLDAPHLCDGAMAFLSPQCSLSTPCESSQVCGSCLSNDIQQQRSCHWCPCSEECLNSSSMCSNSDCFFNYNQQNNSMCYFSQCAAASCSDCVRKGCVWLSQLEYAHSTIVRVFSQPKYWRCFTSELVNGIVHQLPAGYLRNINQPEQCPLACSSFVSCLTCTSALGNVAGPVGCTWVVETGECLSHIELLTNCATGNCGVTVSVQELCRDPCSSLDYCHSCLDTNHCVWCYQNGSDGEGSCIKPEDTFECLSSSRVLISQVCPAEDECTNGHNSCFFDQQCHDVVDGFNCSCPGGYRAGRNSCVPICNRNCSNQGDCVSPNTCHCHFGYTGENCSVQCECNGHSNCANDSVDGRTVCLECLHNTQGDHCDVCRPLFAGSGRVGCILCTEFCHGYSEICIDAIFLTDTNDTSYLTNITMNSIGPFFNNSVCINCQNHTTGRFCNECISGYFYQKTLESFQCVQCSCNEHSQTCNSTTGLDCDCQNNTITVCPPNHSCMEFQCASCAEGYVGVPINGRQCYEMLNHDFRYAKNLMSKQAMFYLVQPKYSNLDVQVFINVIKGSLDVFVSNSSHTFMVTINSTTWEHNIEVSNNSLSDTKENVMSYFNIDRGLELLFSHAQHNLQDEQFYFVLLSNRVATDFNIIFYQAALKLNWFSIMVVVFCSFAIALLSVIMAVYMKRHWNINRNERLHRYITNKRLSRPFSKMHILVNHSLFVQRNNADHELFCVGPNSKPKITLNPVSVQPTADLNALVTTVVIQLPNTNTGYVNLTTGTYLNRKTWSARFETKVSPI